MSKIDDILKVPQSSKRIRSSIHVEAEVYDEFRKICRMKGVTITDVLTALIIDFMEKYRKTK